MQSKSKFKCKHYGFKNHTSDECKYKKAVCHSCKVTGHIATVCKNKRSNVNFLSEQDNRPVDFTTTQMKNIYNVDCSGSQEESLTAEINIDDKMYKFIVDSGSAVSIMNMQKYKSHFGKHKLCKIDLKLFAYSGHSIEVLGAFTSRVKYGMKRRMMKFIVANSNGPAILGRDFLSAFQLTFTQINHIQHKPTLDSLMAKYESIFSGKLGKFVHQKIHLDVKPGSKPMFCKPRNIPYAFRQQVETELDRLEAIGVITPTVSNEWGTPLVPILKEDGTIRICADYKVTLNKCLTDDRHPLPRIENIFNALEGGTSFSKLDLEMAFNQLELDSESAKLAAWSTTRGVYWVNRLPFGIKTATGIFQRTMETIFQGLNGVFTFVGDIIVTGRTDAEHLANLDKVFDRIKSSGLQLKRSKCRFFQNSVKYLGHIVDRNGLSKTTERVQAIIEAPQPQEASEVRAFAGLINYYGRYIKNLAHIMNPMYKLLRKGTQFKWTMDCERAFKQIKEEVARKVTLSHFNSNLPIILETDASERGIGGVLSHRLANGEERPVAFFSRTLTKAESNYPVIQKEALAIVEATKKFYQYVVGHKFIMRTDHKPLIAIFGDKKGIPSIAAARMQRWALHLSAFDYEIVHKKGENNCVADALSRLPIPHGMEEELAVEGKTFVNFVEESGIRLDQEAIRRETATDPILSKVFGAVRDGYKLNATNSHLEPYMRRINELTIESGILMWGYRIIIPARHRKTVMESIHSTHLGIVKCKAMARSHVWWPGIDAELENLIKNCEPCAKMRPDPIKAPLKTWENSGKPWSRIHIDYAGPVDNNYYLVIIDSFSKWPEIFKTKTITASFTIEKLKQVFARFGLPEVIVSDAGTQFTSSFFQEFVKRNGIKSVITPPGHPATNGAAENAVKTFKKAFKAALLNAKQNRSSKNCDDIVLRYLIDYRSTAHCSTKRTPAKLLLGKEIRTRLHLLRPTPAAQEIDNSRRKQEENFRGRRQINFKNGESVMIRDYSNPNQPGWMRARVKEVLGSRTVLCKLENGRIIKRHVNQMNKLNRADDIKIGRERVSPDKKSNNKLNDKAIDRSTAKNTIVKRVSRENGNDFNSNINADAHNINVELNAHVNIIDNANVNIEEVTTHGQPARIRERRITKPISRLGIDFD